MNGKMFNSVRGNLLVVRAENPFIPPTIPNGYALAAAEDVWAMACWIYEEFIGECNKYVSRGNVRNFGIHNISRTISYIIHVSLLEGILKRMYRDMCDVLRKLIDPTITVDQNAIKDRAEEVKPVISFRNMVAAHTIYAYPMPNKGDTLSSELTSLNVLLTYSFHSDPSYFTLGGEVNIAGDKPGRKVPTIALRCIHPTLIEHLKAWQEMFCLKLETVNTRLPFSTPCYTVERMRN